MFSIKVKKQTNNNAVAIAVGIASFVAIFLGTQIILTQAYGDLPDSYYQTLEITNNASNFTEGLMIEGYVLGIKADICPSLIDTKERQECFNL